MADVKSKVSEHQLNPRLYTIHFLNIIVAQLLTDIAGRTSTSYWV